RTPRRALAPGAEREGRTAARPTPPLRTRARRRLGRRRRPRRTSPGRAAPAGAPPRCGRPRSASAPAIPPRAPGPGPTAPARRAGRAARTPERRRSPARGLEQGHELRELVVRFDQLADAGP